MVLIEWENATTSETEDEHEAVMVLPLFAGATPPQEAYSLVFSDAETVIRGYRPFITLPGRTTPAFTSLVEKQTFSTMYVC